MIPDFNLRLYKLALPRKGKVTLNTLLFGQKADGKNAAKFRRLDRFFKEGKGNEKGLRKVLEGAIKNKAQYKELDEIQKAELDHETHIIFTEDIDLNKSGWVRQVEAFERGSELREPGEDSLRDSLPFFFHTLLRLDALRPSFLKALNEQDLLSLNKVISKTPYRRVMKNEIITEMFDIRSDAGNSDFAFPASFFPFGIIYIIAAFDAEVATLRARKIQKNKVQSIFLELFSGPNSEHQNANQWWLQSINPKEDKNDYSWWTDVRFKFKNTRTTLLSNAKSGKRTISVNLARQFLNAADAERESSAQDGETDFKFLGWCAFGMMNFVSNLKVATELLKDKETNAVLRAKVNQNIINQYRKIQSGFEKTPFEAYPELFDIAVNELLKFENLKIQISNSSDPSAHI